MKYKDLINDETIKEQFNKIDEISNSSISHGLTHALNVVENVEKLSTLLNIDNDMKEYLKIAAYLHDTGQLYGKENHCYCGKEYARKYLKDKVDNEFYEKILSSIEKHHEKQNIKELSLFEHIVLFADKMDFSYKRLIDKSKENFENSILDICFDIIDNKFIVIIKLNNLETDILKFEKWEYYPKIVRRIEEFANKINMEYCIKFV